ncbi:MAG TPA: AAA family ATPase, partial [Anaerolineae bacterium]
MKSDLANIAFPLRHVSLRVPWHDAGWKGVVCTAPQLNGACAKLKRISGRKIDQVEMAIAGRSLESLPTEQWPCCVEERATFMAPFEMDLVKRHALAEQDPAHYGHFQPTVQRYPAFSAGLVPFRWLMRENADYYRDLLNLDVDTEREPDLGYETNWMHEAGNQKAMLDGFAAHLRRQESLCFFYAKHVPFVEGTSRVLVGVGRLNHIGTLTEYQRKGEGMRGMIWERPAQHSIRPNGQDGFLIPYLDVLQRATTDTSIDTERYVAYAPDEHWDEFSYGSELVTHDGAISALLSIETAMSRIETELGNVTEPKCHWLNEELVRLWKVRGPFPGLGAVLTAFGIARGIFVAHALQQKAGENADPWPLVKQAFDKPASVLPKELHADLRELAPTWLNLPAERKAYLMLLSRFELTQGQAEALYEQGSRKKKSWNDTDREILDNPYRLYEMTRHDPEGARLLTIDRGVFPDDSVRLVHPLPKPSGLDSPADLRRVRAFCIESLEISASEGDTLLPKDRVVDAISSRPVRPPCPVTGDILAARTKDMAPEIVAVSLSNDMALQLNRYLEIGEEVRKQVKGRIAGKRLDLDRDWAVLLKNKFGLPKDKEEPKARLEKEAALRELAESRFSVLIGPAGSGKTTVLGILCEQPGILDKGVLMLAPTGKSRVRMQQLAGGAGTRAFTIAQFLNQHGRYDGHTGRYVTSNSPKVPGYETVIVDESSMLTEDMLGALFDALQGVKRFIFVGDPAQLPPIGAGRPFMDIIAYLRPANYEKLFPRVAPGYAELTIERRQVGDDRPDLRLARWFGSTEPTVGEDDIFANEGDHATIRFVEWQKPEDFQHRLVDVLVEELKLAGLEDLRGFNHALGAKPNGEYDYFNATRNGELGAVSADEAWQILSPLRGMPFGVNDVNRQLHERFRASFLELASRQWSSIPKPMGAERVV